MPKSWTDLEADGRRIERLCRMMERRIKKLDQEDYDTLVKLANSISYTTKTKLEILNLHHNLKALIALGKRKYGLDEITRERMR